MRPGFRDPARGLAAALIAAAIGLPAASAFAQNVTVDGLVLSTAGGPVVNADLDWYNRDLQMDIDPLGDHTDVTGAFSVSIPAGRYDVTVHGPPGNTHAPVFLDNLDLRDPRTLPDIELAPGGPLTAMVQATGGAPLVGVDLILEDLASQDVIFVSPSKTDLTGSCTTVVPFGTYRVIFSDPGAVYAPETVEGLVVGGAVNLGTATLVPGVVVTGRVVDGVAQGIFNVDLDVVDTATGKTLYTPGDNSDFLGNYSVFIRPGTHDIRFTPSPGSPFAAEQMTDVAVAGATNLGTLSLQTGYAVTGSALSHLGAALAGVDIDVRDAFTGVKRYVPGDFTDAAGAYSIRLPAGSFDLVFNPPTGAAYASQARWNVAVTGATGIPAVQFSAGVLVSGTITGGATPLYGARLDFVVPANGKVWPTPGDVTGGAGTYSLRVPAGTYDVAVTPPGGSGYAPKSLPGESFLADRVLDVSLDATTTGVGDDPWSGPSPVLLARPNPFREGVRISLSPDLPLPGGDVRLEIFDLRGGLVRRLEPRSGSAGREVAWDGRTDAGTEAPRGIYFARAAGEGARSATVRLVKVR